MAPTLASGARLEIFERLDSTNLEARRRVAAGRRDTAFIVALEQTAGYGRRGSAWVQQAGDFAGTIVFRESAPLETLGQVSFVAGLAVAETLEALAPGADIRLKWPNDVLADGGKMAGLLIELLETSAAGGAVLALGIGVNVVSRPAAVDYPTARILDWPGSTTPSPEGLARTLDAAFDGWLRRWRDKGFAPVRLAWLSRCAHMEGRVAVRLPDRVIEGAFRDLADDGALVLEREGALIRVAAGAVMPSLRS